MDVRSPPPVVQALVRTAAAGVLGYPYAGPAYTEAVTGFFARRFGWTVRPEWVLAHVGVYPAMRTLVEALTVPGEEVCFATPVHQGFVDVVTAADRVAVEVPLVVREGRHELDLALLERRVGPRTRLFLLCHPHNPVGRVWTPQELTALSAVCLRRGLVMVSDEVYCGLLYPGVAFTPLASLSPEVSARTATLVSASKSFNLTGLKHALAVISDPGMRAAYARGLERSQLAGPGSLFGQVATEVALRDCDDWSAALMQHVAANYRFTREFLAERLPGAVVYEPEGTYVLWLDLAFLGLADDELMAFLEQQAHVAVTPGAPMGTGGSGHVRLNIGCPRSVLRQGLERVVAACAALA